MPTGRNRKQHGQQVGVEGDARMNPHAASGNGDFVLRNVKPQGDVMIQELADALDKALEHEGLPPLCKLGRSIDAIAYFAWLSSLHGSLRTIEQDERMKDSLRRAHSLAEAA
jgi:hypothetical protein